MTLPAQKTAWLWSAENAGSPGLGLEPLGKLQTRPSADIAASPLSVGYETLDRRHFDPTRTYEHAAQLGVKWARCQTGWARCEKTRGQYDFAWLDEVVDGLRKIGIQPWFNLGYGNPLYSPDADETAVGWAPVFTATAMDGWRNFTTRLTGHFRERVRHYEIWNEPNITAFWKPERPDAARYTELVKQTAGIVRQQVPDAVIIGGALSGMPMDYVKACLEAGLAAHIDKFSYHPYRAVPERGYAADVQALREELARHGGGHIALWQGENGCPSKKGGAGALRDGQWNETRQAKWLLRRIVTDLQMEVELTSHFLIVDLIGYRGSDNWKGLLRGEDYTPKPAYHAYRNLCALFDAETHKVELPLHVVAAGAANLVTVAFQRRGQPLYAYWQPADLQEEFAPLHASVTIGDREARVAKPALLDPLSGEVFRIAAGRKEADGWTFDGMPLLDFPLMIADESVIA